MLVVLLSIVSSLVLSLTIAADVDLTEIVEIDFDDEDPREDDLEQDESDLFSLFQINHVFLDANSIKGSGTNTQFLQQCLKQVPTPPPDLA